MLKEKPVIVKKTPILRDARILVATPNYTNLFSAEAHVNHSEAFCYWQRIGLTFHNVIIGRTFVHFARTQLCETALLGDFTHVFWLDDDATIEPELLPTLIMHDKEVIVTPYPMRRPPHEIGALLSTTGDFRKHETYRNLEIKDMDQGLIEIDGGATHAMLMKTEVLTTLGIAEENGVDMYSMKDEHALGRPYFMMPKTGTEDMYLCYRLKLKGVKIWCDTDTFAGHVGFAPVVTRAYRETMEQMAMQSSDTTNGLPVLELRETNSNGGPHRPVSTMRRHQVDRSKAASLV